MLLDERVHQLRSQHASPARVVCPSRGLLRGACCDDVAIQPGDDLLIAETLGCSPILAYVEPRQGGGRRVQSMPWARLVDLGNLLYECRDAILVGALATFDQCRQRRPWIACDFRDLRGA
ncbi:MAG TPA: hypothetical protein VEK09_06960, partial [Jatrophihabitantaceae bacterium]|nr:hypothetical protein [Jatrophihabitantaceae bacterium]